MTTRGTVKFLKRERGYGFIQMHEGSKDLFFHATAIPDGLMLREGDVVQFDVALGRNGEPAASNVRLANEINGNPGSGYR